MVNYFQLSNGVRVASNQPIDGDRYVVSNISGRDLLITNDRAFNGLQVYVESDKTLYLLEDITIPKWVVLQSHEGTTIISEPKEILFNSGGTISGSSNITYDYDLSILKVSDLKSDFSVNSSYSSNPTLLLKSNTIDGIEINISTNDPFYGAVFSSIKSKGTQENKLNIYNDNLFVYGHSGYYNLTDITSTEIKINAIEWSDNSFTTEYKISTISSGNTTLEERFLIDGNGAIKFNNSYTFPKTSGLTNQVLTQSGNGYLYWNDSSDSLKGLSDTVINNPKDGDKLIYSGGSWINVVDADTIYEQNIGSGGTFIFIIGNKNDFNAIFIHFMNHHNSSVFQMGELQLLHNGVDDAQATTNGQDLDLYVQYTAQIVGDNIELICEVPNLNSDVIMKYTKEIF